METEWEAQDLADLYTAIKSIPCYRGIKGGFLFQWQYQQTCNMEALTCCLGFNWWDRLSAFSRPRVWRGWRVMGNQSQDEWAQYRDLWGAKDHRPLQQGLPIDHHWGPIEEGMWLKQACVEQCSTVWPTCLSSWVSVPLIEGVDSLFMLHKAMSVPPSPLTEKGGFLWRGHTHYHVVAFSPTASGPHQLNGLCGWHSLYICVLMEGGSCWGRKQPIE